jgi:hypothetical protein
VDRSELVGRERELELLDTALAAARDGRGQTIVLIGEPGIGKTSLVSAIARDAGTLVLWGACSGFGAQAWEPIARALDSLFDQRLVDAAMVASCGVGLLAIVPEAGRLVPDLVAPVGADPETIAFTVARATTRLLRQICLARPCVLVIDDVHDADAATLRLVARLAQESRTMPLLIAMTAREGELAASAHAAEVAELSRVAKLVRITALDRVASTSLIRRVAPALAHPQIERVLATADGNPLYLGELAAVLATRSSAEIPIPVGIKASIGTRLDRLPADTRRLVNALAVLGTEAAVDTVGAVAGVATNAIGTAVELGIVVELSGRVRLLHALVRDVAYAGIAPADRSELHRRAAGITHDTAERVRHFAAAGDAPRAIDIAIDAAHAAELHAADDEAVSLLETAATAGNVDDARRARLLVALGRARLRAGHGDAGVAACVQAAELGARIGDPDVGAAAALARGSVFRFGHVDRGLVAALRTAIDGRAPRDDAMHARLLARLAGAEQPSENPWRPIAMAHEAFAIARRIGDERVLLAVLHDGGSALVDIEDPRRRVAASLELRDLARRLRAPWYELRATMRLVFDHADLGDVAAVDATIDTFDGLARSFAHPRHQWRVALVRAARAASEGKWGAADRHAEEAIALGGDDPMQRYALFGQRYTRLRLQQRADDVLVLLDDERDLLAGTEYGDAVFAAYRAAAHARAGRLDEARRAVAAARPVLALEDLGLASLFSEAAAAVGDRGACLAALAKLEGYTHRYVHGGPMFCHFADPAERYLGIVLAALGDRERAIRHLESALERARTAKLPPAIAQIALDLANLGVRSADLSREARTLAEQLDLVDLRNDEQPADSTGGFSLVLEGDAWAVTGSGRTFRLRDSRGLRILAKLVERAGTEIHALELVDGAEQSGVVDRGDAGEMLDARARAEYRARLVDLREDLADAEARGDLGWIDRLRTESEAIEAELSRAFSKSGRARRTGAAAERARSAVTRRVREAIAKIGEHDPELGKRLAWHIRTGMMCSYRENPS